MERISVVLIATALLGFGVTSPAVADDVAVIVNKSNPVDGLTIAHLRKIVLGQENKWPTGQRIAVVMTTPGQPERDTTLRIVCGMSETSFTLHFMRASFNGETADPPKPVLSGMRVRQFVAGAANAVGFIKASQLDDSVKAITIDGNSPGESAYKLKLRQ